MLTRNFRAETGDSELLLRLHSAHEELLVALDGLALLTRQFAPDPNLLGTARWNLSKAGMHRRLLGAEISAQLLPRASGLNRDELLGLRDGEAELLALGTDHVRRWTPETIASDWEGYCEAVRALRTKLIARMAEERRIFHRMFRNGARQAPWSNSSPWATQESA